MRTITRGSTCGTIGLPEYLACSYCKASICKAIQYRRKPPPIKKCLKPFTDKWADHREKSKVELYNNIQEFLGCIATNDDMSTVNNHDNNNENSDLGSVNPRAVDLSQSVTSESSQSTYSNLDSGPTSDNTPN